MVYFLIECINLCNSGVNKYTDTFALLVVNGLGFTAFFILFNICTWNGKIFTLLLKSKFKLVDLVYFFRYGVTVRIIIL